MVTDTKRLPLPYIEQESSSAGSKAAPNRPQNKGFAADSQLRKPAGFSKPAFINSEVNGDQKKDHFTGDRDG